MCGGEIGTEPIYFEEGRGGLSLLDILCNLGSSPPPAPLFREILMGGLWEIVFSASEKASLGIVEQPMGGNHIGKVDAIGRGETWDDAHKK